jgi:hypothetical protein
VRWKPIAYGLNGCEGKQPSPEIHPKEIKGASDVGYVLDLHAISSTMIGYNEFGHPESDTQTSPPGRTFQEGVPGEYAGAVSRVMATHGQLAYTRC